MLHKIYNFYFHFLFYLVIKFNIYIIYKMGKEIEVAFTNINEKKIKNIIKKLGGN